jgi:erythromycin esterase
VKKAILVLVLSFVAVTISGQKINLEELVLQRAKDMGVPGDPANDLSFLDSLLKDARIVMLGESSHGTEEYSVVKKQLIRYLHEKLGFNVVLFESPMTSCSYLDMGKDTSKASLVKNSVQWVWHTETVKELFAYISSSGMRFNGFDPQFIPSPYPAYVYEAAFGDRPALLADLVVLERRIAATIHDPALYLSLKDSFSAAYGRFAAALDTKTLSPLQQWLRQTFVTSTSYYTRIRQGDQRDSCMAKNITWLAENLYKNEKLIIWAHNTHIDRNATSAKRLMGKLLSDHFKDQLYAIGLYMLRGRTATNDRKILTVQPPPKSSIEGMMEKTGFRTSFLETGHPAFDKPINTLYWGRTVQKMNLYKSFDAIILVHGVLPPVYLQ